MENVYENIIVSASNMMSPERRVLGDIQNKFASDALSPTTNLKLLTEVASDLEKQRSKTDSRSGKVHEECKNVPFKHNAERKLKSLTLLCEKFLQIFPLNVPPDENIVISLDNVAERLGTERRRLYDIINMLDCLQMARKVAKNKYRWFGCQKLHVTLAHLKGLAIKLGLQKQVQEMQARTNLKVVDSCSDNEPHSPTKTVATDLDTVTLEEHDADGPIVQFIITSEDADGGDSVTTLNVDIVKKRFEPVVENRATADVVPKAPDAVQLGFSEMLPKIKSLGMLCQSFLMIFLVADESYPITLDNISRILGLPVSCEGDADSMSCTKDACPKDSAISYKTKLRRLYDIANVLSSLHIICKIKRYELLTKKPLFKYTGPALEVAQVLQTGEIKLSNSTRHSLLGNELLDTTENETMLELKFQLGNHPQWIVSTVTVDSSYQHKRKLQNHTSETTPKLARTKSNDVLCRKKKNDSRHETTKSSLDGIFNIAERELQRLQSMDGEPSQPEAPEKRKRDNKDEQPTAARRRLFSRHHSEPCINSCLLSSENFVQPAVSCGQKMAGASSAMNEISRNVQQHNGTATGETNSVVVIECSEFRSKHLEQRMNEIEKQCAVIPTQSGQKLKIVRRFEKLSHAPLQSRSVFIKTYTCRPVKVLPRCSSSESFTNSTEPKTTNETNSLAVLGRIQEEVTETTGTVVSNINHMAALKDVDYTKLPKLKLVKVGNVTKLVPLCSINAKHQ